MMNVGAWVLVGLIGFLCLGNVCCQKLIETVYIREFGECDIKGTLFHMERMTVNLTGKGTTTFNGQIDADEDLGLLTMLSLKLEKCRNYGDRDSGGCELYGTLKYPNPCDILLSKTMPWAPLFTTKPPLTCPIKKGVYVLHGASIKPGDIKTPAGIYWRFMMRLYVGNRVVSCMKGGVEKMSMRVKQKPRGS